MAVKRRDLTTEQMAAVECPTCGAAVGEVCELNSGGQRFEPHRDRKLAAADAVEAKLTAELKGLRDQQLESFSEATFAGWTADRKKAHQQRSDRIAGLQGELNPADTAEPAAQFPNSSGPAESSTNPTPARQK